MSKRIDSNTSSMTLVDFARMVHMTSSGGFATSIKRTSGIICADKSGRVYNIIGSSTVKGDAARNRQLREQLVSAFGDRHASAQFLAVVRKALGLDRGVAGADASKPLSRRTVKFLLKTFNEGIVRKANDKGQSRPTTGFKTRALQNDGVEFDGWVDVYDTTDELAKTLVGRLESTCPDVQSRMKAVKEMFGAFDKELPADTPDLMDAKTLRRIAVEIVRLQMRVGPTGGLLDEEKASGFDFAVRNSIGQVMFDELLSSSPKAGEEKKMIKDLERLLGQHAPGAMMHRLESVVSEVLLTNPLLTIAGGTFSSLGHTVRSEAMRQFRAAMKDLRDEEKIAYLKNYKVHARAAAKKMNDVLKGIHGEISSILGGQKAEKMLKVDGRDGQPVDKRSLDLRCKAAVVHMRRCLYPVAVEDMGPKEGREQCIDKVKEYIEKNSRRYDFVGDAITIGNYNADVALQTADMIKKTYNYDIPDGICEALVCRADETSLASKDDLKAPKKIGSRAKAFADMFGALVKACNQDKDKASKLFLKALTLNIDTLSAVTDGVRLLKSIESKNLELPETVTPESLKKFCGNLAKTTLNVATDCLKEAKEAGNVITSDDLHGLYGAFTLMLFSTREDAKDWLARQDEKDLTAACCVLQNDVNVEADVPGAADEVKSITNMNMSRFIDTILFLKQSVD